MTNQKSHKVPVLKNRMRLQEYAIGIFEKIATKSALKKAIKKSQLLVNGEVGATATYIFGGEIITFVDTENKQKHKLFTCKIPVLIEDDYLAIIYKPPGILVSGNSFATIANCLEQNLQVSPLPDAVKPQPVHRLDYATSGVLLVGKTASAITFLSKLFENRQIEKTYMAVTIRKMDTFGEINLLIDDKKATTAFEVLKTVSSKRFDALNLVKLTPKTGRKHQLRKHLSAIGNPILGDSLYTEESLLLKGKGLYLHASSLSFIHPFTKKRIFSSKELPKKYGKLFD